MSVTDDQRRVLLSTLDRLNVRLLAHHVEPDLLAVDLEDAELRDIESAIWNAQRKLRVLGEQ